MPDINMDGVFFGAYKCAAIRAGKVFIRSIPKRNRINPLCLVISYSALSGFNSHLQRRRPAGCNAPRITGL